MDPLLPEAVRRLATTAASIRELALAATPEQAAWRPAADHWSILEVVNHLADEEAEDFRTRLDFTLHRPGEAPPEIAPERWARERGYNERELAESVARFMDEREWSIEWLRGLDSPEWERPFRGSVTAAGLLGSWLAHDLLHLRQLSRLHHQWLADRFPPHALDYAGGW
jgi:hypothetical protein